MKNWLLLSLASTMLVVPGLSQPPGPPPAGPGGPPPPPGVPPGPRPAPPPPTPGPAGVAPARPLAADAEIPLDQAIDAARTALETCLANKSAVVVAVVDLNGHYKVLLRAPGTGAPFYDYMRRKAYTVLKKGMSSEAFGKLPEVAALPRNAVIEGDPGLITFPGAVPIKRGATTIGVLSVSGPTGGGEDMKCTMAGMAKFRL